MGIQVGQVLRQTALRAPERVALVDLGDPGSARRELTYAELDALALRVAARLSAAGVEPGDRVGLLAENSAECTAAWFGIVYAGAAVVPLHVLSAAPELATRVGHARCKVLLHDTPRTELAREAGAPQVLSLAEITAAGSGMSLPGHPQLGAAAMVLYTSGTTGAPKGAVISHASLLLHTSVLAQRMLGLAADSVVLCVLPLSHSYGCRMALLAPLFAQARIVMLPRFAAARSLAAMQEERVTWAPVVPTMLAAWAECPAAPGGERPAALRWVLSAGAPLGDEVARRAEARLGVEVRQGYGMTEATFSAINAPPDERVFGSVGRSVWGVELRIVDSELRDVTPGETGEVLVRGHNLMTHYLDDLEANTKLTGDGFLRSGDIGRLDDAGRLYVVDRIKDLIIRGGYNVYPAEVESALAEHPSVVEVAVVGQPDDYYGEEVVAVAVLREACEASALAAFADARLGKMRRPRYYAFVESLPLGPSGKVQKRTLREWIVAGRLALHPASP
ncbi:MAG TPA: AMP-binding protein [Polyangiales bacterium]|nr:AMP-binding protein [Polyangiales bacterium]